MLLSQTDSVVATRTKSLRYPVVIKCAKWSNCCRWHAMWHRGAMILLLEKYESIVYASDITNRLIEGHNVTMAELFLLDEAQPPLG
jgi:hypothetical protein